MRGRHDKSITGKRMQHSSANEDEHPCPYLQRPVPSSSGSFGIRLRGKFCWYQRDPFNEKPRWHGPPNPILLDDLFLQRLKIIV